MGSSAAGSTSGFPDWVILWDEPRFSELRNETTAECETSEGQTVEVSFWLVDPPGVSYFSVNCPGLGASVFHEYAPPSIVCAEAAFVLFSLTFKGSIQHFVYRAAPAGKQSLQQLPDRDPNWTVFRRQGFGLLPCADGEHYAVAYIDRECVAKDFDWWFHVRVFSSVTRAWSSHRLSLRHLSKSEKLMCCRHGLSQQIVVAGSLGWVDLMSGILLLRGLLDGGDPPVIQFIPFPESRVSFLDEDGHPQRAPAYYCNVACYDHVIKFIEIDFDDSVVRTSGQGWRTTMWERNISWNKWQIRSTVDVSRISIDQSCYALLPGLWCDDTQKLDLKKLIFYTPVPSRRDDNIFYMMAKVNAHDETAWAVAVDMERAAVEAMAPFSLERYKYHIAMYCPCDFSKYLNLTTGADMHNPVGKCFKRSSAKHCVVQVLSTLDWLRELDQCLEIERSTYNSCRSLLQFSPVSSLRSSIRSMVKHASYNGQREAASEAVEFCLRALEDFDLALHKSPRNGSASIEAMRSKIIDIIEALDDILQIVPLTLMPKGRMLRDASDQKRGKTLYETCEKPSREEGAVVSGRRWLLSLICCLLISIVLLCPLPWIIATGVVILIPPYLYGHLCSL